MLRMFYIFQKSGLMLYSWNCPRIPKDSVYEDAQVSALISALIAFSESVLHKNMQNLDLDEGGFMTIVGKKDLYIVGFFSDGDFMWRAKKLLNTILTNFLNKYQKKIVNTIIKTSYFNNFDDEITILLRGTSRKRNFPKSIIIVGLGLLITLPLLILLSNTVPTKNLAEVLDSSLQNYIVLLIINALFVLTSFASGPPDFRLAVIIELLRASSLLILMEFLWPLSPFYLTDLLWLSYFVLGLTGCILDRLMFLKEDPQMIHLEA